MSKYFKNLNDITSIFLDNQEKISSKLVYGDNVMCSFITIEANTIIPEHKHPEEQILVVLDGRIKHTVNGETKILSKGDIAIQPANIPHSALVLDEKFIAIDIFSPIRNDFIEKLMISNKI